MKNLFSCTTFVALCSVILLSASCEKTDIPVENPIDEKPLSVGFSGTNGMLRFKSVDLSPSAISSQNFEYLVNVLDTNYYNSTEEFYERVAESIQGVLEDFELGQDDFNKIANAVYAKDIYSLAAKMFINSGNGAKGRIEEYTFEYKTKSATGEDIVVSGVAVFPNYQTDGINKHIIDGLTLSHDHLKSHEDYVSSIGSLEYLRAIFNQVVVLSDYEGYRNTYGVHPYVCYNELARQSIDCAQAALELLDYVGVKMKKGYKTYNMGMSKGGGVAMATQKMLENSEPEEVKAKFDLAGSYCATGLYDFKNMMIDATEKKLNGQSTEDDDLQISWIAATVIYLDYISHKSEFGDIQLKDFFTENFYSIALKNKIFSNPEIGWGSLEKIFKRVGIKCLEDVLNPVFFVSEGENMGRFNEEENIVKRLFAVLDEENPSLGWIPRTPLLMEHSYDDALSNYDVAVMNYNYLKYASLIPNPNVGFNTYYKLEHSAMSGVALVRMAVLENPSMPVIYNVF